MREIVLDTETTGLDPAAGHRIVEIACLELLNGVATGGQFQRYVNPERDMPEEAFKVHGLSADFLARHPFFAEIVGEFLEFIESAPLVIHNAEFDLRFINAELALLGRPALDPGRAIDTLPLARRRFPGAQVSLDALCRRFGIDNSARSLHGALLDCELLAEVYLELNGGRQPDLGLAQNRVTSVVSSSEERPRRPARVHEARPEELEAHKALVEKLRDPIWRT
ncbi:MAG: DNA polymerase III subunit epsilon [Rhodospirillales bacterium]|nr:DNA polymerase III subunit epsilon [Rhodospirillales bacterium]MDH3912329.1 DNA polymerase III subunit epsilon [Rhodospirillales bacterium]MDH3918224.1 DNA polymerase III subunit epsilon [Rhodospirillales bacterium]MDH3965728.1 DNA polymerase III subunit epsilon [Rhodospirillales bacterium]